MGGLLGKLGEECISSRRKCYVVEFVEVLFFKGGGGKVGGNANGWWDKIGSSIERT